MQDPPAGPSSTPKPDKDRDKDHPRRHRRKNPKHKSKSTADSGTTSDTSESTSKGSSTTIESEQTFSERFKRISQDHPPSQNPIGFSVSVLAGICCASTAVGVGFCIIIGLFCFIQLIPVAAIIVGAVYANREKYCPAENISVLLIVGGTFQMLQVILSETVTVRTTRRRFTGLEVHAEEVDAPSNGKRKSSSSSMKHSKGVQKDTPSSKSSKLEATKSQTAQTSPQPTQQSHTHVTKVEVVEIVVEEKSDNIGRICNIVNLILSAVNILWFISASIIVYRLHPNLNVSSEYRCNDGLYSFAFWYITSIYIVIGIVLLGVLLVAFIEPLLGWIFKKWARSHRSQTSIDP